LFFSESKKRKYKEYAWGWKMTDLCPFCGREWNEPSCLCGAYTADMDNPDRTFKEIYGYNQQQHSLSDGE